MASPLDDLRNMSKKVNAKKLETEKNLNTLKKKERVALSQKSIDQQQERKQLTKEGADKSKKIKIAILVTLISILSVILFLITYYLCFPPQITNGPITLVSDNFLTIKATDPNYSTIKIFTSKIINTASNEKQITDSQWYKGLSLLKRKSYQKILDNYVKKSKIVFIWAKYNKESGIFKIRYESDDESALTFKLVYDKNYKFKIVKVQ